jgi:adenylate cyclase
MDYTVIGDGVNLAARLESACKQYGTRILISEYTFRKLRGTYRGRQIDRTIVKGKKQPVGVYEILEFHTERSFPHIGDVLSHFKYGIESYREGRFKDAMKAFGEAGRLNPDDKVSQVYIARCEHLLAHPPGPDWDGVWVMESK